MTQRSLRAQDYMVGWVCALPIELAAAKKMLDEKHQDLPRDDNDTNLYTLGRIGKHNVVIACLPAGQTGTNSAATVAVEMRSKFKQIQFGLMVGIGGGVPTTESDIRLGDVVVSQPCMQHGGVVQYDFGKTEPSGFTRTGFLNTPPAILLKAVSQLRANHDIGGNNILTYLSAVNHLPKFAYNNVEPDILFESAYKHIEGPTCAKCSKDRLVKRTQRTSQEVVVHYGAIASGNQVIKDGVTRDRLSSELGGVLCFEMEAAGLMNYFPCLVIRGICDYADSHKNKTWQPYAAATAAACAKEVLSVLPPAKVIETGSVNGAINGKDGSIFWESCDGGAVIRKRHWDIQRGNRLGEHSVSVLDSLSTYNYDIAHRRLARIKQEGTGGWILTEDNFKRWFEETASSCLWCSGIPGAGKTILTTTIVEAARRHSASTGAALAYFYCNDAQSETLISTTILRSLMKQLITHYGILRKPLPQCVDDKLEQAHWLGWESFDPTELSSILLDLINSLSETFLILDGLDECDPKERRDILKFVTNSLKQPDPKWICKFLVASREEVTLRRWVPNCFHISINDTNIYSDICSFVDRTVDSRLEEGSLVATPSLVNDIKQKLIEDAKGMFLWVTLQIEAICDDQSCICDYDIRAALEKLPKTLNETYLRCLERINRPGMNPTYALRSLKWVTCAKRLLHIDELKEAIAFSSNDRTWNHSKISTDNHRVINSCANLIVLDETDNTVRLAHHTVKEFLFSKDRLDLLEVFKFDPQQTDLEIGEACIGYLSFSNFQLQNATANAGLKSSVLPSTIAISALSGSSRLTNRLTKSLFSRTGQHEKNITILHEVSISAETSTRYRLLGYARVNWPMHTINISETSSVWGGFKDLALEPNRPWKLQPWGSNTNSNEVYYRSLFEWAIEKEHLPLLNLLRSLGSRDRFAEFSKQQLRSGGLPLHYVSKQGLERVVELLLHVCNANTVDENGETALHQAAIAGHTTVVELLLTVKGIKLNLKSKRKRTVLSLAAENGHKTIARMLIERGAQLEIKDNYRWTALYWAARNGHEAVVRLLLEKGADVNARADFGRTALYWAAGSGHEAVVRLLLEKGADVKARTGFGGIEDVKAGIDSGETALSWAAENGHEAVVRLLLEKGADVNARANSGGTALSWAAGNGREAVVRLLLEKGADVNARAFSGGTALSWAAGNGREAVVRLLLEKGADVNARAFSGGTALSWTARNGHEAVVRLLLEKGADVNAGDKYRETALSWTARNGHEAIVRLLLEKGADVNAGDDSRRTALSWAAGSGREAVVRLLLEKGADVNAKALSGGTALSWAARSGHEAVVRLLKSYDPKYQPPRPPP